MTKLLLSPTQKSRIVRVLEANKLYYTDEFTHILVFRDVIYLIDGETKHYGFDNAAMIRKVMSAMSFQ